MASGANCIDQNCEAQYTNPASETETRDLNLAFREHVLQDFIYIFAVVDFMERERNNEQGQRLCGGEREGSAGSV